MRLPATIGRYQLEEFLGGSMAEVYRAVDTVLGRTVAFKQLTQAGVQDEGVRARFLEEAKTGSQLTHDNIVRTFDYGEDSGQPYIVMEFLAGTSLTSLIKSKGLGDFTEKARMALEMARALEYLHSRGILHRDIKPDNIHIDFEGRRVRLIDFGIDKSEGINSTQAGFTPLYMAPEQLSGALAGPATDVYAFGLVFFEILTGRRARQQILKDPLDYAPLAQFGVPEPLRAVVREATQARLEDRPDGFSTVIARLEGWIESQQPETTPARLSTRGRQRLTFGHTASMMLMAAIVGGLAVGLLGVSVARARLLDVPGADAAKSTSMNEMAVIQGASGPFEMDRTEVTNEKYASFCKTGKRALPPGFRSNWPGQPVTGVTIDDARAYCFALGKHLPSEQQWDRAARGTSDAQRFPWGDNADSSRANVDRGSGNTQLVSAASMQEGASPEGVLHLIGNAAEWVDQPQQPSVLALEKFSGLLTPAATPTEPWYVIKGGSFRRSLLESSADLGLPAPGRYTAADVGFRCAR